MSSDTNGDLREVADPDEEGEILEDGEIEEDEEVSSSDGGVGKLASPSYSVFDKVATNTSPSSSSKKKHKKKKSSRRKKKEGEQGEGDGDESSPGSRKRKKKRKRDRKHHHHHHRSDESDGGGLNSSFNPEKEAVLNAFDSLTNGNSYRPTEEGYGAYDAYDKYAHKSAYSKKNGKSEPPPEESNDVESDGSGSCYSDFEFCTSKGANLEGADATGADYDDESFYGVSFDPKKHQQRLQSSMEEYHNRPSPHPYPSIPSRHAEHHRFRRSRKTAAQKLCKFFLENKCKKGNKCPFLHQMPDTQGRKLELCGEYLTGRCKGENGCEYLHADYPCKAYFVDRYCYNDDACVFSHRQLDDVTSLLVRKWRDQMKGIDNSAEIAALHKAGITPPPKPQPGRGLLQTPTKEELIEREQRRQYHQEQLMLLQQQHHQAQEQAAAAAAASSGAGAGTSSDKYSIKSLLDIAVEPTQTLQKKMVTNSPSSQDRSGSNQQLKKAYLSSVSCLNDEEGMMMPPPIEASALLPLPEYEGAGAIRPPVPPPFMHPLHFMEPGMMPPHPHPMAPHHPHMVPPGPWQGDAYDPMWMGMRPPHPHHISPHDMSSPNNDSDHGSSHTDDIKSNGEESPSNKTVDKDDGRPKIAVFDPRTSKNTFLLSDDPVINNGSDPRGFNNGRPPLMALPPPPPPRQMWPFPTGAGVRQPHFPPPVCTIFNTSANLPPPPPYMPPPHHHHHLHHVMKRPIFSCPPPFHPQQNMPSFTPQQQQEPPSSVMEGPDDVDDASSPPSSAAGNVTKLTSSSSVPIVDKSILDFAKNLEVTKILEMAKGVKSSSAAPVDQPNGGSSSSGAGGQTSGVNKLNPSQNAYLQIISPSLNLSGVPSVANLVANSQTLSKMSGGFPSSSSRTSSSSSTASSGEVIRVYGKENRTRAKPVPRHRLPSSELLTQPRPIPLESIDLAADLKDPRMVRGRLYHLRDSKREFHADVPPFERDHHHHLTSSTYPPPTPNDYASSDPRMRGKDPRTVTKRKASLPMTSPSSSSSELHDPRLRNRARGATPLSSSGNLFPPVTIRDANGNVHPPPATAAAKKPKPYVPETPAALLRPPSSMPSLSEFTMLTAPAAAEKKSEEKPRPPPMPQPKKRKTSYTSSSATTSLPPSAKMMRTKSMGDASAAGGSVLVNNQQQQSPAHRHHNSPPHDPRQKPAIVSSVKADTTTGVRATPPPPIPRLAPAPTVTRAPTEPTAESSSSDKIAPPKLFDATKMASASAGPKPPSLTPAAVPNNGLPKMPKLMRAPPRLTRAPTNN